MSSHSGAIPVVLLAAERDHPLVHALAGEPFSLLVAGSGTVAIEWARDIQPDLIVLEADLPDMSGIEVCRRLQGDLRIGNGVPLLVLTASAPGPDLRVAALRAGAWDFLDISVERSEIVLRLETYIRAKHSVGAALAQVMLDPTTGLHTLTGLARRARELGALMGRKHGSMSCIVFNLEGALADPRSARLVARSTRLSDVVGLMGPSEVGMLAPATDATGAVAMAARLADLVRQIDPGGAGDVWLRGGYETVASLRYSWVDPVEMLMRAAAAVKTGVTEREYPWLRRHSGTGAAVTRGGWTSQVGMAPALERRREP